MNIGNQTVKAASAAPILAILFALLLPIGKAEGATFDSIKLYGYFDLGYSQTTGAKYSVGGQDDPNQENGSFDLRHMNILTDITVSQSLFVKTHIEFEHGIHPSSDAASLVMEYGFAEYVINDALKFRGGKMLTPIGIFGEIHDATPAYLSVSPPETFYRAKLKGGHMVTPKWTTGLAVLGTFSIYPGAPDLEYVAYVGNGESRFTTNESEQDDNPNKAIGGRLQFSTAGEILHMGISVFQGDKAISQTRMRYSHTSYGGHASVTYDGFNMMAEYAKSKIDTVTESTWYVQASMRVWIVAPYVRYQRLEPNNNVTDDGWAVMAGGVNFMLTDALFLKVEWDENRRGKNNESLFSGEDRNYGELLASLTMMF